MTPASAGTASRHRPDHVIVVGAGVSGLTAAYRLSQAGVEVTVVEADRVGGRLQTSVFAGRPVDEAADAFLLRVPWAVGLCHDLDIDGELISPAARDAQVWVEGAARPLPTGHVLGVPTDLDALAASGTLSPDGLARVAAELDLPAGPPDPGPDGPDVAIGPYLRHRLGDEAVDRLVDPLVGGINAGDTAHLSLAAVVPQLDAAARSGDPSLVRACRAQRAAAQGATPAGAAAPPVFAAPIGGMARLVDALVALMPGVDLVVGHRVTAIEAPSGGPPGATPCRVTLDDGRTLDTGGVVLAVPAHVAAGLLAPVARDAGQVMGSITHSSISMVTLAFDRDGLAAVPDRTVSGLLVPRTEGLLVTAVSYATNKWAQLRDPERDDVILRVSAGRAGDDRQLDLDDADLTAAVLDDLHRLVGVRSAPTEVRVVRCPDSFPQYAPGHLARIDALDAALAGTPVAVAGMALRGVGIPACIRSGELAAASFGASWPTRASVA